jgi:16S rRNA processing protein RimM
LSAGGADRSASPSGAPDAAPLSAGRVGRPHGLDGSFHVTRGKPRLLAEGTIVSVAGAERRIERRAGTDARPILRLEGLSGREAAEAIRGAELTVAAGLAPALEEGEFWAHELEGCEVRDGERLLGTVTRLIELPSCEALEVSAPTGGIVLVPMVRDAIRSVEPGERLIEVDCAFLGLETS